MQRVDNVAYYCLALNSALLHAITVSSISCTVSVYRKQVFNSKHSLRVENHPERSTVFSISLYSFIKSAVNTQASHRTRERLFTRKLHCCV